MVNESMADIDEVIMTWSLQWAAGRPFSLAALRVRHFGALGILHQASCNEQYGTRLTAEENVASTDEFTIDVKLRDCWPVTGRFVSRTTHTQHTTKNSRELLDALPQLRVLQDVVRLDLLVRDTLHLEYLHRRTREAALRLLLCALHEEHNGRGRDGLLDLRASVRGDEPSRDGQRAGREDRCRSERRELYGMVSSRPSHM